jgi:hypothetical protein
VSKLLPDVEFLAEWSGLAMHVTELQREIPVYTQTDVLVAGAGVAGCAAALAAARMGARTMLIERSAFLGGVATAGLMANIGNKFYDRQRRPVIFGIPREVIERLVARGGASAGWSESREVPGCVIDSEMMRLVLAEMLHEAGVRVLTNSFVARPIMDGKRVAGAFVETKIGRQAVLAHTVVDCTGEADVAYQAGCPMWWRDGSASLEFKMVGVDLDAFVNHFADDPGSFPVGCDLVAGFPEFQRNFLERGILFFPHGGGRKWNLFQDAIAQGQFEAVRSDLWELDAFGLYALRGWDWIIVNSNFWTVSTLDPEAVAEATRQCQEACYYVADFCQRQVPGFEHGYVAQMANDLGIRTSRGIHGRATLLSDHVHSPVPTHFEDSVGLLPAVSRFEESGHFVADHACEIPFGVMVPHDAEGLLVASGKSVSTDRRGLIRGMSTCMILGQAAGTAGALAAHHDVTVGELDMERLQVELAKQGVMVSEKVRQAELSQA